MSHPFFLIARAGFSIGRFFGGSRARNGPIGPIRVGVSIDLRQFDKVFGDLGRAVADLRPVFHRIDLEVSQLLKEQFETRGARLGTPWAPIADATMLVRIARRIVTRGARRRAGGAAGRDTPLRDTNRLMASFVKPGAPGSLRIIDMLSYQRGSQYTVDGFPVAAAMNRGFKSVMVPVFDKSGDVTFIRRKGGPKQVPARPIIPEQLPAPVLKAWEGYLAQHIEHGK